jgi:photosystem II stability/assembly factor-like uncharacterized protein
MRSTRLCSIALLLVCAALLPRRAAADDRWVHLGPFGGPVFDVVVAPSAHRTLYAAAESGVYRSDDAAAHWHPAWEGLPSLVRALAVDPSEAGTVYAGTWGVDTVIASVYKTVDHGATWTPLGVSGESFSDIAVDPHDPARILVAAHASLFRSEDGGATWSRVSLDPGTSAALFVSVAFDPSTPGVAYAASSMYGIFKSVDGGLTWTRKQEGLPPAGFSLLQVAPSGAVYATPVAQHPAVVFRSLDQGEHWARLGAIPDAAIRSFAFSPDGSVVLAGTDRGLFRKKSTGAGWTALRPGRQENIQAVAADPVASGTFYAGLGSFAGVDGVLKSSDRGATWKPANEGLAGLFVLAAAIAPSNPAVIYASVGGYTVVRSSNGGATWRVVTPAADIFQLAVDPRDEDLVYAAGGYGRFWRSRDGGASWTGDDIEDGGCAHPLSLTLDPQRPERLLLAGYLELGCARGHETSCLNLESTDGGESWTCLKGVRDTALSALVPDPRHLKTLYGVSFDGVSKSTDGGKTWSFLENGPRNVSSLVISPQGTLWAGSASVFKSRNGGRTWRRAARGFPANGAVAGLVRAPSDPSVLYAVVSVYDAQALRYNYELYASTDGGLSWRRLPEPHLPVLPNPFYTMLVDPRDPGRLYVGTPLGLYRLDGALD